MFRSFCKMVDYQVFNNKIQAIEAEIAKTDERIQANFQEIEGLKSEVDRLEAELLSARKVHALDASLEKRKAVADLQKRVTKSKAHLDDLQILDTALAEKRAGLRVELKSTIDALRWAEVEALSSKAQRFIDQYEEAIRAAHRASVYLRVIHGAIQGRKGMDYLRSVCPAASSLYFVPPSFDLPKCHNGYPIPLHDSSYDREAILEELLFCSPETVQEYKEHVMEAVSKKVP
jgi:archaellum component FlaC